MYRSVSYTEEALRAGQDPTKCEHGFFLIRGACTLCDAWVEAMYQMIIRHDANDCVPDCACCYTTRILDEL